MLGLYRKIREVLRQYLEDREDYLKGIVALERREPTITLEDLEMQLASHEDRNQRSSR